MKHRTLLLTVTLSIINVLYSQNPNFERIDFLMGKWEGSGSGFGNDGSKISSIFKPIFNDEYIFVKNHSIFEPTEKNPQGEEHKDWGNISYDKNRDLLVYRQFNSEGYINQYTLNDSLSNGSRLVLESETIENFVPGGKARWTIIKISEKQIETIFDVSFPNKEYTCFGKNILHKKEPAMNGNTPKVTGIGGVFFFADNVNELKEWYGKNLGLEINEYGSSFEFRNANKPNEINYLQWSLFNKDSDYFEPSKKEFMINYRVQNIDELVVRLKGNGVKIVDEIKEFEYGKFVHIMDPEGNKIELWEPVDAALTELGGKTTK